MDFSSDPIAIIGTSCRLPGGVTHPTQIWPILVENPDFVLHAPIKPSRVPPKHPFPDIAAGWISHPDGVDITNFDAPFFGITPGEAQLLRPNVRLALELTHEALLDACIAPEKLRGRNITVSIASGVEDGWDVRRVVEGGEGAYVGNHHWAASSDPSGIAGRIAHWFDLRGSCVTMATGCSGAGYALRDAVLSLHAEKADLAVVGGLTTHFHPAAFEWAKAVGLASELGRCSTFGKEADGYVPSESAVFFVLARASSLGGFTHPSAASFRSTKLDLSHISRPHILIRSLVTAHNGATRTLAAPSVNAQQNLMKRALDLAGIDSGDVAVLEAHGTGTRLGDAIEVESIRSVYGNARSGVGEREMVWLSSSKTVFGHCQAGAAFVGILKMIAVFTHQALPPHHVTPIPELTEGVVRVPVGNAFTNLNHDLSELPVNNPNLNTSGKRKLLAQLNSFGFTGSIVCMVLEEGSDVSFHSGPGFGHTNGYDAEATPTERSTSNHGQHGRNGSDYSVLSMPSTLKETDLEESVYESAIEGEDGEVYGSGGVRWDAYGQDDREALLLDEHDKKRGYLIPFSAKTPAALKALVGAWVRFLQHTKERDQSGKAPFSLRELATLLSLGRDHYKCRRGVVVSHLSELEELDVDAFLYEEPVPVYDAGVPVEEDNAEKDEAYKSRLLSLFSDLNQDPTTITNRTVPALLERVLSAYESGAKLKWEKVYNPRWMGGFVGKDIPGYAWERERWWSDAFLGGPKSTRSLNGVKRTDTEMTVVSLGGAGAVNGSNVPSLQQIAELVAHILSTPPSVLYPPSYDQSGATDNAVWPNIFDHGADSLNVIEISQSISKEYGGVRIESEEMYLAGSVFGIQKLVKERAANAGRARNRSVVRADSNGDVTQEELDAYIDEFGRPVEVPSSGEQAIGDGMKGFLVTGSTGSLGSQLVVHLLSTSETKIRLYLPIRPSQETFPLARLVSSFSKNGLGAFIPSLQSGVSSGQIVLLATKDVALPLMGLSEGDWTKVVAGVDVVIHSAWKLDFNSPLGGFRGSLEGVRRIAELCSSNLQRRKKILFLSSFSASFGYGRGEERVPEMVVEPRVEYSIQQGYAFSKLVAEHALYRLQTTSNAFDLHILRIAQISGHTQTGAWNPDEMVPMLIKSAPMLGCIQVSSDGGDNSTFMTKMGPPVTLERMPDVSWVGVDTVVETIGDLLRRSTSDEPQGTCVWNVANPHVRSWRDVAREMLALGGVMGEPKFVSLREYVGIVKAYLASASTPKAKEALPIRRLLPYFMQVLDKEGELPGRFCNLDVTVTAGISQSLKRCEGMRGEVLRKYVKGILGDGGHKEKQNGTSAVNGNRDHVLMPALVPMEKAPANGHVVKRNSTILLAPTVPAGKKRTCVFLFGPWSAFKPSALEWEVGYKDVEERVFRLAQNVRDRIGYTDNDDTLDKQLKTLCYQLCVCETLEVTPKAVIGYCFGEYAAAIVAGIMTEEAVIEVVVRRARVLNPSAKPTGSNSGQGLMLNVFSSLSEVKCHLVTMPSSPPPPDIAIVVGPRHIVLSGEPVSIRAAGDLFKTHGVKTLPVPGDLAFHSPRMDTCSKVIEEVEYEPNEGRCTFVSGILGRAVRGRMLKMGYWRRHLRECVRWEGAVNWVWENLNADEALGDLVFVDIGPGVTLLKTIERFGGEWKGRVVSAKQYKDMDMTPSGAGMLGTQPQLIQAKLSNQSPVTPPPPPPPIPVTIVTKPTPSPPTYIHMKSNSFSTPEPSTPKRKERQHSAQLSSSATMGAAAVDILHSTFSYPSSPEILHSSFHSLGLHSMDFVQFCEIFKERTGKTIRASAFVDDGTIGDVIKSAA